MQKVALLGALDAKSPGFLGVGPSTPRWRTWAALGKHNRSFSWRAIGATVQPHLRSRLPRRTPAMAAERESPSVADYVVTAIGPALIMLMVGSLVFFLVEVLYAGKYSDRLLYTFFFFVMAAVLVARISIQYDAGRAAIYGIAARRCYLHRDSGLCRVPEGLAQFVGLARQSRPDGAHLVERAQTDLGLHAHRRENGVERPGFAQCRGP